MRTAMKNLNKIKRNTDIKNISVSYSDVVRHKNVDFQIT